MFFGTLDRGNIDYVKSKVADVNQELSSLLPDNIDNVEVQVEESIIKKIYNRVISNKYVKKFIGFFKRN